MIQFIVGALAVVGLSELAKSKKMPKMANGGKIDDMQFILDEMSEFDNFEDFYNYFKDYDRYAYENYGEEVEPKNYSRQQLMQIWKSRRRFADGGSMSDTKKSRVEKFFSLLFESRDVAHKEHLKTKSYATHIALNEYYEGVLPLIDGMVESYQGIYGIVEIPEWKPKYENPIIYLKDLLNTIDREKDELFTDSSLLNQVDEIKALVQSTLYKLENLK